jgi:excisionase family DNA binding protein
MKRHEDTWGAIPKGFVRIPEAAAYAGLSENAYRAGQARGELPYTKVGGRILVNLEELEEFLRSSPGVTAKAALANQARRASR